MIRMTAGAGAERLFVWSTTRYVVVPDFFGNDMVFDAETCDLPRFGLPSESFLLNLLTGGDAMTMCVWRSPKQQAHAILTGEGPARRILGCEIEGVRDPPLWVAFLEAPAIWHERPVSPPDVATDVALDWRRPFPAEWRADFVRSDGFAQSTGNLGLSLVFLAAGRCT